MEEKDFSLFSLLTAFYQSIKVKKTIMQIFSVDKTFSELDMKNRTEIQTICFYIERSIWQDL